MYIGCHLSSSKGFEAMGLAALSIGANIFQFFTRNPRGSKAKDIDPSDVEKLIKISKDNNFGKLLAHAPYTLNPASDKIKTREFAKMIMEDDLNRMEHLPNSYYNFHPGSHVGQGVEVGINYIIKLINDVLKPHHTTIVLLETMAGKGTEIGGKFEELKWIIDGVRLQNKIGVCLDTCHIYEAGYDIVNGLDGVLDEFEKIIGLDRLYAIHLNDSKNPLGSRKDRHEKIGQGTIGLDGILKVINHPKLKWLPFYLETPNDLKGYGDEIKLLKALRTGKALDEAPGVKLNC